MNISIEEFERLSKEAFDNIPLYFKDKLENIEIVVDDRPQTNPFKNRRFNLKGLLGLYRGVPLTRRGIYYSNVLNDKIILYKDNIESQCRTEENLREKIREVLLHEIGHYFGLNDKDLREIEKERD